MTLDISVKDELQRPILVSNIPRPIIMNIKVERGNHQPTIFLNG